jgi:hypothetical protein
VVAWVDTDDGHRCESHNVSFRIGEVCHACVVDPGAAQSATDSIAIDAQHLARGAEFRTLAKYLHREGRDLIADGTAQDKSVACKLIAEGTKLERLALELEDRVSARDHDRTLIRHERDMSGQRGSH